MAVTFSNAYYQWLLEQYSGATVKAALMATGFALNPDTHDGYADVSASEIAAGNGYTAGGLTLANLTAAAIDDANNRGTVGADDLQFAATGGNYPAASGVLYYVDSHASKRIIGFDVFAADVTVTPSIPLNVTGILFPLQGA